MGRKDEDWVYPRKSINACMAQSKSLRLILLKVGFFIFSVKGPSTLNSKYNEPEK